jgi:hypothetical protein
MLRKWGSRDGWRVFAVEVGVIVLGVLIALAAQQAADAWSVRQDSEAARNSLRQDLVAIVVNARERTAEDRCIRGRLEYLAKVLDTAPARLPAIGEIGSPPGRNWYPASWDSVVGTKVATTWPRDDFVQLGQFAQYARRIDALSVQELDAWTQLYRLVGPSRTWSAEEIADLRAAVARAAYALNLMRLAAPQIERLVEERGLLLPADRAQIAREVRTVLTGPNYRAICGPIGPVPAKRVTAPYDPAVQADPLRGGTTTPASAVAPSQ